MIWTLLIASSLMADVRIHDNGNWSAKEMDSHPFHGTRACSALARSGGFTLEVYTERLSDSQSAEATIQVIAPPRFQQSFFKGALRFDGGQQYALSYLFDNGLLAKFDDRQPILYHLRQSRYVDVYFFNQDNRRVRRQRFSLRGSSQTIRRMLKHCNSSFFR